MKKLVILLMLVGIGLPVYAQLRIEGKIFDIQSGESLPGATIQVMNTDKGVISDADGYFSLQLEEGQYNLKVSFVGYESKTLAVSESTELSIGLNSEYRLEEIVIRAIRGEKNVPVTRNTLERQEIENQYRGQDPVFLFNEMTPSVVSYSESGTNLTNYGQMRLRGIDQTRINITLDGAPLNDMIDHGVFFSNFTDFANSVESIQVQRGVGTSTNGTSSYAGSINFQSLDLRNSEPETEIQLTGGSFSTLRASAELKTGLLDNDLAFYTRFTKTNSQGYRHHTSTDSYSLFFSGGYYGEKDMVKITGFTGQSKNGLAYSPVALSDIEQDPKTNYVNENDIDDFGQDFVQLQYTRSLTDHSSWVSSIYYGAAGGDFPAGFYTTDSIYSSNDPGNYFIRERFMQINFPLLNDHIGVTSYFNHSLDDRGLGFSAGIHAYNFKRQNLENIVPEKANPYYHERSRKNEFSAFAKAEYTFGKLSFLGDVQFRTMSLLINPDDNLLPNEPDIIKNWTFLNPKIGLTYAVDDLKDFYVFYGYNGREPTKVDILGGFQLNPSNLASAKSSDVKPEYVHDIEGGFRYQDINAEVNINAFFMQFNNEIAPIGEFVPEGFIQLRKNIPSSYRTGLEIDWLWRLIPELSFKGNATYMKSRISEYDPEEDPNIYTDVSQPFSPEIMTNAGLVFHYRNMIELELSGRYIGESYLEPTNQPDLILPSFFVADTRLGFRFLDKHTLNVFFNNIFDKQYFTYGAPVDPDFDGVQEPGYFVQPPRNINAMLILRF